MALTGADAARLAGTAGVVRTRDGHVVGALGSILLEPSGEPTWALVHRTDTDTGEQRVLFVPLHQAGVEGTDIRLPYPRSVVDTAPATARPGELGAADETVLLQHYTLAPGSAADSQTTSEPSPVRPSAGRAGVVRSEERLRVGLRVQPRERLRVTRQVVVEDVTITVPVRREELRVERIPLDDHPASSQADRAAEPEVVDARDSLSADGGDQALATAGAGRWADAGQVAFDQDDLVVVLHEERVVWDTEVVPVEQVRLQVRTVTHHVEVGADLHVENVELTRDRPGDEPGLG